MVPIPEKRIADFEKLGFGMFVHWGLYSQLGMGEWTYAVHGRKMEDYQKLEEKAITEVEGLIEKLPKPEQISAAHEGLITGARKAYDALPEDIRAKISNIDVLEELEKALEKVKETAPQNG